MFFYSSEEINHHLNNTEFVVCKCFQFGNVQNSVVWGRVKLSFTAVRCLDSGYVGKDPVGLKEYCVEYLTKELQESIDRCTGCQ